MRCVLDSRLVVAEYGIVIGVCMDVGGGGWRALVAAGGLWRGETTLRNCVLCGVQCCLVREWNLLQESIEQ